MLRFILDEAGNILAKDPAARSLREIILCYPGLKALVYHRIANKCYERGWYLAARLLACRARRVTGIEIHPGAQLGRQIFIDHGMGVVIGETAVVGNNVTMFHGVTLGGLGNHAGKRHPTIEDDVLIGAGAKILGPITVGRGAKIGANAVVLQNVEPYTTVVGIPAREIKGGAR